MTTPLVSICVPTYNRATYLRESLESILNQDYHPLEILISDNASTDQTERICRDYAARDGRIRYIRHPRNRGVYGNHNFCIQESRGPFLCFFHDDDRYEPNIITRSVTFLLQHPEVGMVCSDWQLIDDEGRVFRIRKQRVSEVIPGSVYVEKTLRSGRSSVCTPGTVIRRLALGDVRFDETGPIGFGDFVVWFKMAERHAVGHIPEILWSYRKHQTSLSRRTVHAMAKEYFDVLSQYCKNYLERWPDRVAQARQWEGHIHRYLFWALAYEICLRFREEENGISKRTTEKTFFERMSYQLSEEEFQEVKELLLQHQQGIFQQTVRLMMMGMLKCHLTWPLRQMARHPEPLRAILGMK